MYVTVDKLLHAVILRHCFEKLEKNLCGTLQTVQDCQAHLTDNDVYTSTTLGIAMEHFGFIKGDETKTYIAGRCGVDVGKLFEVMGLDFSHKCKELGVPNPFCSGDDDLYIVTVRELLSSLRSEE